MVYTLGNRMRKFKRRVIGGKMFDCLEGRQVRWIVKKSA